MLLSILGSPGAGKASLAKFLKEKYSFEIIDIEEAFYKTLSEEQAKLPESEKVKLFYSKESQSKVEELFEEAFFTTFVVDKKFVIFPITTAKIIELLRGRKYVYIVGVSAPIIKRYTNFKNQHNCMTLEEFVHFDDWVNFGVSSGSEIRKLMKHADFVMHNSGNEKELNEYINSLDFVNPEIMRPGWDRYFMQLAELVSRRSNCFRRAVGAVLAKDYRIIATGYNGAPFNITNCNKGGCPRCIGAKVIGKDLDKCICIHSEESAVIESGRANAKGATIYTTTFPCLLCAKAIVQAGIKRVVYFREYDMGGPLLFMKSAGLEISYISPFILGKYLTL